MSAWEEEDDGEWEEEWEQSDSTTGGALLLPQPALAPGFLACVLLFVFYEVGLAFQPPGAGRNLAELFLSRPLLFLGSFEPYVRSGLLIAASVFAYRRFRRSGASLRNRLVRTIGEGVLAGMLLGPFLMVLLGVFDAWPGELAIEPMPAAPPLAVAMRLFGAAVWEELVFRLGFHSILFLILSRLLVFFGVSRGIALWGGDVAGLIGSSVIFAAFHMEDLQRWIGVEEVGPSPAFLWRLVAGLVLAALYRWRGLGVAAWAHGLFNLGLALGGGPGVFR